MKQNIKYLSLILATVGLAFLTGCSTQKTAKSITTSPTPYVIAPDADNKAQLDLSFHVPRHYFSKRSRIVITPQLLVGDSVIDEYQPLVLHSSIYDKKMNRLRVLKGYNTSYADRVIKSGRASREMELPYSETIHLPNGIDNARVAAVVSTDGCGRCTGFETIDVATFGTPATLIDPKKDLKLSWIEPEFKIRPKVMEGKGVANLQFVINKYDINLSLGDNRSELEDMVAKLSPVLNDTLATLTSLRIFGMASADGPLSFNTILSLNRANAAKDWLVKRLSISPEIQKIIEVDSRPEGWEPVLEAMVADNHPDAETVREILTRYADQNDDVAEKEIRRLACWNDIRDKYLQKDRKVEYAYTYSIKSFTDDAELLEMYKIRPDAFNEEELLRVASLAVDDKARKEIYLTLLKYFPQSAVAANNLAVLYLREGNVEEAQHVLNSQKEFTPELLNTLAAIYVYRGDYERAIELLKDVELSEARYNLGLLKAKQRKLDEAYELLRPYADINSAILALCLNRNDEARSILAGMELNTPMAEYVAAMVAARYEQYEDFIVYISQACTDERLRRRAVSEPDFCKYKDDEQFQSVIKQ